MTIPRIELEREAYLWSDNLQRVLTDKNRTIRALQTVPEEEAFRRYHNTLNTFTEILNRSRSRIKLPARIEERKTKYRVMIVEEIDKRIGHFSQTEMTALTFLR
jgi:F420-0:gamma-glutamyl ligase-like protein